MKENHYVYELAIPTGSVGQIKGAINKSRELNYSPQM